MPKFALKNLSSSSCLSDGLPCGVVNVVRMASRSVPQDRHASSRSGNVLQRNAPQQIEADITNTFERFFTLGANIDHSESRSLTA